DAEPAQGLDVARLRAGAQVDLARPVEGVDLEDRAERGRRHGHLERAVPIVAAPDERLVRLLAHREVDVSRGPAGGTHLALARELDARPRVDSRGDVDAQRATRADAALARALGARLGDHGPEPVARRARLARHDLAEEGPSDAL